MKIWIIGGGKFGLRAARRFREQKEDVTVVDPSVDALAHAGLSGVEKQNEDGPGFLFERLRPESAPDWIVPAVPVHLAWEWCRLALGPERLVSETLPGALVSTLPTALMGASGDIYVSHADFICPSNCSEPDDFCSKTRKPRKEDMFRLLARAATERVKGFVVQSRQLGPGIGGYQPRILFELISLLERYRGACFVATACRCHGVISGGRVLGRAVQASERRSS